MNEEELRAELKRRAELMGRVTLIQDSLIALLFLLLLIWGILELKEALL